MTIPRHINVGNITIGNDRPLALIAGPCQIESRAHALEMAHALVEITGKLGIGLIYKSSFDKANRSSIETPRGLLVARDELAGWLGSFNQYKQGQGGDVAHWLEMHRAGALLVDRKSGDKTTIHVARAAVGGYAAR